MNADKSTVIDANADVEGKLRGKDAQILGRFQGEIQLTGRLQMGEGSPPRPT
jgi:cytoskeletal protein CcmA (bactofilin family)